MRYDKAEFEAAYGTFSQLPESQFSEIAFAGRSNVGKSSLINKIFNRKSLARVSSMPGKTITINFYKIADEDVKFVDLPGYGYAKVSKSEKERWAEMMEGYFNSDRKIKLVIQLIDMRHAPTKDDLSMLQFLLQSKISFIVAMTKSDKLKKKSQRDAALKVMNEELSFLGDVPCIPFSAVNGEGTQEIKKYIEQSIQEEK